MRCVETTFPPAIVVTPTASPAWADGVMHTNVPFSAGVANAEAPGTDAVQHPTHPSQRDPVRASCAETDVVAMATRPSAARQRFSETKFIGVLVNES
jgi:hypothetical protein